MRRLYFLVPDTTTAKAIVDDLLRARITWRHIHVLANHSVALEQLPEASLLQSSDVVHSLERGVALGGATGAFLGLVALVYPPAELAIARKGHSQSVGECRLTESDKDQYRTKVQLPSTDVTTNI